MLRRDFLRTVLAASAALPVLDGRAAATAPQDGQIVTVRGPIPPGRLGPALPHEHVLVDFVGAADVSPDRYDAEAVFRAALPHLERVRALGCRAIFECTPAFLGRDPALLRRLADAADLHLVTNTGYYAAGSGKYLPEHARTESAEELAARWIAEARDGIGGTGIRPGFLKIGVDAGPLPEVARTIVRAAALTHRATGLTIAAHTGDGAAALEELDILAAEGVAPSAFIWVHAHNERDMAIHAQAAGRGAWVEFDGIGPDAIGRHVDLVRNLADRGHLGRILLSHDAGWYHVGEPGGGDFRPYTTLFEEFLPALKAGGFDDEAVRRLTVANPAEAFAIGVRARP